MKRKTGLVTAALVVLCALAGVVGCQAPARQLQLLRPAEAVDLRLPEQELVLRSRDVKVDFAALKGRAGDRVQVPLFDRAELTLVFDRREEYGPGGFVWSGHSEKQPSTTAVFAIKNKALVGNIRTTDGRLFQIRQLKDGVYRLFEVDVKRLPDECPSEGPSKPLPDKTTADTCATDPPTEIDVLVVYTSAARAGAGGADPMEATIFLAVAETNQSYLNSDIDQRLRLVHVAEVSYTESGNSRTDVNRLQDPNDTFMDNVHTLRDTNAADMVVLITETLQTGVLGEVFDIMGTVSNAFESSAFCVVKRISATGNFSFGHELGHLMGARHDWGGDPTNNSPHAFNHGHAVPTPSDPSVAAWRTIMARQAAGGTRVQFWSNPNIDFPIGATITDPMGRATGPQQTDNHQTLNLTAPTVANFRCSSPSVSNVWMKDTWNDTGAEPDPLTAAEAMWKSPYIWVRNTQDSSFVHQHEHQNPEFGSQNYVYVKLHNGASAAASGDLEVYYAHASTSLTWPSAWTLIGKTSVTGFAAHAVRIVEQAWSPPGTGHYCLLARWVSPADPMATAEGADIGANVRSNNNLVWRNVNIVDLTTGDGADVAFLVRNPGRVRSVVTLSIRGPKSGPRPSFLPHGTVLVQLDDRLMQAWKEGGQKGSGFKVDNRALRIGGDGATLENLLLPPKFEGRVVVQFRRLAATPRRVFEVDIVHSVGKKVIGGMSYEIHTDRTDR